MVDDADAAHDELAARGVEVSDAVTLARGRFVTFTDPDGNSWTIQQLRGVLPGY